ncbi:MAG: hypothetical protein V1917_01450 [Candidatus Gottesmanbacteria bacterium]
MKTAIHKFFVWFSKRWKRWERHIKLSKRQQFVLITGILTLVLMLTQLVPVEIIRYPLVFLLACITYAGTAFVLREDLGGIEWVTLLIPPMLYSAAVALFYFLLPPRWLTRIPIAGLYAIGLYAFLLTENIYNVAANRTIALLRAARSVGFLLTIFTYYLLTLTVVSFRSDPLWTTLIMTCLSFLHIFPSLWLMELTGKASRRIIVMSIALSVVLGELAWVLSFWPMPTAMIALLMSSVFYSTVGIGQEYLANKLYKKTVIEFFLVCIFVFAAALFTTKWRGI